MSGRVVTRGWAVVCGCALVMAAGWDRAVWLMVSQRGPGAGTARLEWLERMEGLGAAWGLMRAGEVGWAAVSLAYTGVYAFGRIWLWILLAAGLVLRGCVGSGPEAAARAREGVRRGVFVVLVPAAAGLMAEALKFVSRRMRPEHGDGFYRFKGFEEGVWDMTGLGLASSHAAVGVAGALAAGVVWPRLRWVMLGVGLACAGSRVAVGAHYLSDVLAGGMLGVVAYRAIYAWDRSNNGGAGLGVDARGRVSEAGGGAGLAGPAGVEAGGIGPTERA